MSVLSDRSLSILYPGSTPGPSSIDLHLGDTLLWWPDWVRRDPRRDQSALWRPADLIYADTVEQEWVLRPGIRYLGSTRERVEIRPDCAGQVAARSSWARDGLSVIQGPAGFLDAGFSGTVTLELSVIGSELVIWPGAAVAQLIVHRMTTPAERPYAGKYQDQTAPSPSRMHLEVERQHEAAVHGV